MLVKEIFKKEIFRPINEGVRSATMGQAWVIVTSQEKIKASLNVRSEKRFFQNPRTFCDPN